MPRYYGIWDLIALIFVIGFWAGLLISTAAAALGERTPLEMLLAVIKDGSLLLSVLRDTALVLGFSILMVYLIMGFLLLLNGLEWLLARIGMRKVDYMRFTCAYWLAIRPWVWREYYLEFTKRWGMNDAAKQKANKHIPEKT